MVSMRTPDQLFYQIASGIDVVPLSNGDTLFRSDALAVRLEGSAARIFAELVVPFLNGERSLAEISKMFPNFPGDDLQQWLDDLVRANVLRCSHEQTRNSDPETEAMRPFFEFFESLGISTFEARKNLARLRVIVFGLEGHGAHVAAGLAQCGIGELVLVDPFPFQLENKSLMPLLQPIRSNREDTVATALQAMSPASRINASGGAALDRERITALATGANLLIGCFDKGFSSTHHWINQASLSLKVPALFAECAGHIGRVGPLVLPAQTACYMCYRMRRLACTEDFDLAMSYEEFLDKVKRPSMHTRATLPGLPAYLGSLVTIEAIKYLLSLSPPALADKILEFDAFSLRMTWHPIVRSADCVVCQKKNFIRNQPGLAELEHTSASTNNLLEHAPRLISSTTGIVCELRWSAKDISEPFRPYIFRALLSNHRFVDKEEKEGRFASGKGMTIAEAQASALAEALERYSGACWKGEEIIFCRRCELDTESVDPRELVLFAPSQYTELRYSTYSDDTIFGWVRARSLITDQLVFVPALAVFMNYEVQSPAEFIFPMTSNGLAAGPTLPEAILRAAFEVLERDAAMITWLNELLCTRVDPLSHPDPDVREICKAYQRRRVHFELYLLPTDHPVKVFVAIAYQEGGDGPAAVLGLGADTESRLAARRAILEAAQVRPGLRQRMRFPEARRRMEELVDDPRRVTRLEDHDLLYASPKMLGSFDFLRMRPHASISWQQGTLSSTSLKLGCLTDHFQTKGADLLYFNLTTSDLDDIGLHTARVIIPGFQPIDFGWKERRLGGERLYELPQRLGLRSRRQTLEDLNPRPHPIS
jgi:ribosomal protein S12 methylthiotransferase accessory factor